MRLHLAAVFLPCLLLAQPSESNVVFGTYSGLALLMDGRRDEAVTRLTRAAERYRESSADAPPGKRRGVVKPVSGLSC